MKQESNKPKKPRGAFKPIEVGDEFDRLTVIDISYRIKGRTRLKYCLCKCSCGNEKEVLDSNLNHKSVISCGCIQRAVFIESGQKYGRWTVLKDLSVKGGKRRYCLCRCDCGVERKVLLDLMKRGMSLSCGCYASEVRRKAKYGLTHGQRHTDIYTIWHGILQRCLNKKATSFPNYGGRGISIFPKWLEKDGFLKFRDCIGPRPSKSHTVDRIDNDGNYEPGNIKWSTRKEQASNRRPSTRRIKNCPLLPLNSFLRVTVYDDPI